MKRTLMTRGSTLCAVFCAFLSTTFIWAQSPPTQEETPVKTIVEASGIAKSGDLLYIVGDETKGQYYTYDISGNKTTSGSISLTDPTKADSLSLNTGPLKMDLEGLTIVNGKVLAISEKHLAVVSEDTVLIEYPEVYGPFGNRGLEGIAGRILDEDCNLYELAAIWEGGYPEKRKAPPGLDPACLMSALPPVIITQVLKGDERLIPMDPVELNMSALNIWANSANPDASEPEAHRFRAPDLVWFHDCFIVLLSSERHLRSTGKDDDKYKHKVIQRFGRNGQPIGAPYPLLINPKRNWEGMGWFVEGQSLIFIHDHEWDNKKPISLVAEIVEIPMAWKEKGCKK